MPNAQSCLMFYAMCEAAVIMLGGHSFIHSLDFKVLGPTMTIGPVVCKCQIKYPIVLSTYENIVFTLDTL